MACMRHEKADLVSLLVRRRLLVRVPKGPGTRDECEGCSIAVRKAVSARAREFLGCEASDDESTIDREWQLVRR